MLWTSPLVAAGSLKKEKAAEVKLSYSAALKKQTGTAPVADPPYHMVVIGDRAPMDITITRVGLTDEGGVCIKTASAAFTRAHPYSLLFLCS